MGYYETLKEQYPTSDIIQLLEMEDDVPYRGQDGVGLKQALAAARALYGSGHATEHPVTNREKAIREILHLRHRYLAMASDERAAIEVVD